MKSFAKFLVLSLFAVASLAVVPTASALPKYDCLQRFAADMNSCTNLDSWWMRSLCGGDAELSLAACAGEALSPWKK